MGPLSSSPIGYLSLVFKGQPALEGAFAKRHNARARAHDQQAAGIYLLMVASGSVLYFVIALFLPENRVASIDNCTSLIICSWIGPAAHLLLLFLVPDAAYARHRTAIVLGLRLFYLLATSINGFGMCGVGPVNATAMGRVVLKPAAAAAAAAPGAAGLGSAAVSIAAASAAAVAESAGRQLESPFSALLWRSGIIGMTWYAGAFPLLFWQHCLVQSAFLLAYYTTLSRQVCSTLHGVAQGSQAVSAVLCLGHTIWAGLLSVVGANGLATEHAQKAAAAAAAALAGEPPGGAAAAAAAAGGYGGCMRGVCFLQLLLGHVLPSLLLYCAEARSRVQWWLALQRGSSSSSGGGWSSSSGDGGLPLLRHSSSQESLFGGCEAFYAAQEEFWPEQSGLEAMAAGGKRQQELMHGSSEEDLKACRQAGVGSSNRLLRRNSSASSSSSSAEVLGAGGSSSSLDKPWAKATAEQGKQQQWKPTSGRSSDCPGVSFDRFGLELLRSSLPPGGAEVFVAVLLLGLAWLGLGAAFSGSSLGSSG